MQYLMAALMLPARAARRNPPRRQSASSLFSLILDAPAPFDSERGPKENGEGPNAKNADSAAECALEQISFFYKRRSVLFVCGS